MTAERVLLVKGRNGMGNRVLGLLTGVLYARLAGRTPLVDWSDDVYSSGTNAFPQLFRSPLGVPPASLATTDSVAPALWRGHLADSVQARWEAHEDELTYLEFSHASSIQLDRLDYEEEVVVMWSPVARIDELRAHFTGPHAGLRRLDTRAILRRLLAESLAPCEEVAARVARIRERLPPRTIGVHVRYTDRRGNLEAQLDRVARARRRDGRAGIFLCTDNREVLELFRERFGDVLATDHWYPQPGARMHRNAACGDPLANGLEALVDLYVLAGCDPLVVDTSSTFAVVAALAAPKGTRVVDVRSSPSPARTLARRARERIRWLVPA